MSALFSTPPCRSRPAWKGEATFETDVGFLRILEHGSSAAHIAGEPVNIGFSPDDSLVFDTASERLVTAARVGPPA